MAYAYGARDDVDAAPPCAARASLAPRANPLRTAQCRWRLAAGALAPARALRRMPRRGPRALLLALALGLAAVQQQLGCADAG